MKRLFVMVSLTLALFAVTALAHDPRTVIKDYGASLSIEETGKFSLVFKALHWNEASFQQVQANPQVRKRLNDTVWAKIGSATLDFDIVAGESTLPKGSYSVGINFTDLNQLQLVFKSGEKSYSIPLKTTDAGMQSEYLSFAFFPTEAPDTFEIEGRYGKFKATQSIKVPALATHAHETKEAK